MTWYVFQQANHGAGGGVDTVFIGDGGGGGGGEGGGRLQYCSSFREFTVKVLSFCTVTTKLLHKSIVRLRLITE